MSETIDLTLLSTQLLGLEREVRLLRLQSDALVSRVAATDARIASLEQGFHELIGEVSRGFGQSEQRAGRLEKRLDEVSAGLESLHKDLTKSTSEILEALKGAR